MSNQFKTPTPALFFNTVNAYQRTAAIKAAIDLDIFTAIGEGIESTQSLAGRCLASVRGIRILCDYLVIIGFLTKETEGYRLTPDSAMYLNRNSKAYVGSTVEFLLSPLMTKAFDNLAAVVRNGGTTMSSEGTLEPENPV